MNRSKRLLIIGASAYQHYIYRTAKDLGLKIYSVDANAKAPMFSLADAFNALDFSDTDSVTRYAIKNKINAVATINLDQGMQAVTKIQQNLGLKHLDMDLVIGSTRKDIMRQVWKEKGVSQPNFWIFSEKDEKKIIELVQNFSNGLIIKPVDNAAKRGISLLQGSREEIENSIHQAFKASKLKKVIVEEFIQGTLIFAATYILNKYAYIVTIIIQEYTDNFVQTKFSAPHSFGLAIDSKIINEAILAANCFGWGPFHTEMIISPKGTPYVLETSPRVSYATISLSRIIERFDPVLQILKDAFDEDFEMQHNEEKYSYATLKHVVPVPGSVFNSKSIDVLKKENIYEIVSLVEDGHKVKCFTTNEDRVVYFTAVGNDSTHVEKICSATEAQILKYCFA